MCITDFEKNLCNEKSVVNQRNGKTQILTSYGY